MKLTVGTVVTNVVFKVVTVVKVGAEVTIVTVVAAINEMAR